MIVIPKVSHIVGQKKRLVSEKSSSYLKFPSWKDFKKGKGTIRPLVQTLDSEVMIVVISPLSLNMTMRCELVRHLFTMGLLLTCLNIKF